MKCLLGNSVLNSLYVIILSETPKSPATLKYKIYTFYVGHTYQSTHEKKDFGPEGVKFPLSKERKSYGWCCFYVVRCFFVFVC